MSWIRNTVFLVPIVRCRFGSAFSGSVILQYELRIRIRCFLTPGSGFRINITINFPRIKKQSDEAPDTGKSFYLYIKPTSKSFLTSPYTGVDESGMRSVKKKNWYLHDGYARICRRESAHTAGSPSSAGASA